jgi:hypothetical protein
MTGLRLVLTVMFFSRFAREVWSAIDPEEGRLSTMRWAARQDSRLAALLVAPLWAAAVWLLWR